MPLGRAVRGDSVPRTVPPITYCQPADRPRRGGPPARRRRPAPASVSCRSRAGCHCASSERTAACCRPGQLQIARQHGRCTPADNGPASPRGAPRRTSSVTASRCRPLVLVMPTPAPAVRQRPAAALRRSAPPAAREPPDPAPRVPIQAYPKSYSACASSARRPAAAALARSANPAAPAARPTTRATRERLPSPAARTSPQGRRARPRRPGFPRRRAVWGVGPGCGDSCARTCRSHHPPAGAPSRDFPAPRTLRAAAAPPRSPCRVGCTGAPALERAGRPGTGPGRPRRCSPRTADAARSLLSDTPQISVRSRSSRTSIGPRP